MSDLFHDLATLRWASLGDRTRAEQDAILYGNVFTREDADGLVHRINPATVTIGASALPKGEREESA